MSGEPAGGRVLLLLGSLEPSEPLRATLALLEWCRQAPAAPTVRVLAQHSGAAADRVRSVATTSIVHDPTGWSVPRIAQRARLPRLAARLRAADLWRRLRTTDPVYVADASAAGLLRRLGSGAGPVVTHLHESERAFEQLDHADRELLIARTDAWIVGSAAKRSALLAHGIEEQAITERTDLLDVPGANEVDPDLAAIVRRELEDRHGIPVDARIVVGIGAVDWWSVPDAFVRVAWEATRREAADDLHLLWIADGATERMLWPLRHDIDHAGLGGRVHIDTGPRPAWHHIAAADVLLSTRLGDHAPAGHREAALIGRPILWFDDPEAPEPLVDPAKGTAVAFFDVDAMADAVAAVRRAEGPAPGDDPAATASAPWLPGIGGPAIVDLVLHG